MADRITFALRELVTTLEGFADTRLQARHGISIGDFVYLATIAEQQPVDLTALAQCLMLTKAAVSKRMPQLVAAGWVRTAAGPGRRILVSLTDAGADLVRRAGDELDGEVVDLFADPRLAATGIDQTVLGRQVRLLTSLVQERLIP